jgi:hypothetical protein
MYMTIGYPQAIRSLAPTAEWTMTDVTNYATLQWFDTNTTQPTKAEVDAEVARLQAEEPLKNCKEEAKKRIAASDWSVLPDVGLSNVSEFEAYRATLRALIKNPVANPSFPTEPNPVWS